MSANSTSFPSDFDSEANELTGVTRETVDQIRGIPAPPGIAKRVIQHASSWTISENVARVAVPARGRAIRLRTPRWVFAELSALAFVAIALAGIVYWNWNGVVLPENSRVWRSGFVPRPDLVVAADATILVAFGGEKPIELGAQQSYGLNDKFVHVWDWSKGTQSRPLPLRDLRKSVVDACGLAVSPDGKWIVMCDGRTINLTTSQISQLDNFGGEAQGLRFSPDGKTLLVLMSDGKDAATARLLDFPSAKKRFEIDGQYPKPFACAFTPDGSEFLLFGKDRFLHRWDANTGNELARYEPAFSDNIRDVAVSPEGKYFATTAHRAGTCLWELASGKMLHKLDLEINDPLALAGRDALTFSPDSKLLAVNGLLNPAIWATDSGKLVQSLPPGARGAAHFRFSKDGKTLTSVQHLHGVSGDHVVQYPTVHEWSLGNNSNRN